MNSVSGPISRDELALEHELLGGERGPRDGARLRGRVVLGEHREVVGAATDRIEQRVVGLVDARLRAGELGVVEERRGGEAARRVDLALALEGAADLLVVRACARCRAPRSSRACRAAAGGGCLAVVLLGRGEARRRGARCARCCARPSTWGCRRGAAFAAAPRATRCRRSRPSRARRARCRSGGDRARSSTSRARGPCARASG